MPNRPAQFAVGTKANPVRSPESQAKGSVALETVLAKRDRAEILRDMKARSIKTFGR
jgi:hypothetical protein